MFAAGASAEATQQLDVDGDGTLDLIAQFYASELADHAVGAHSFSVQGWLNSKQIFYGTVVPTWTTPDPLITADADGGL